MQRTQISLASEDRRLLDAESKRTGRSISALIRDAVQRAYGSRPDHAETVAVIDFAFGAWTGDRSGGEIYVERLRSGRRLEDVSRS